MAVSISGGTLVTGFTPPTQPRLIVGSSIHAWGPFSSPQTAWEDGENGNALANYAHAGMGQLSGRRVYDSGPGSNFVGNDLTGKYDYTKRITCFSIKPDFTALAAGSGAAYTAAIGGIDAMLADTDPSHKVIFVAHHEFNGDYTTTQLQADFRAGTRAWATRIKAQNNPNWKTAQISTTFGFKTTAGANQHPDLFWPGPGYLDCYGLDGYNAASINAAQGWDSPPKIFGPPMPGETGFGWATLSPVDWILQKGIPFFVGEVGTIRNHNAGNPSWCQQAGIDPTKDAWFKFMFAQFADWNANKVGLRPPCLGVFVFNSNVNSKVWLGDNTESWELWRGLPGDDSYDAMQFVNQTYGYLDTVASGEPTWPFPF